MESIRRTFSTEAEFRAAWEAPAAVRSSLSRVESVAGVLASPLSERGFEWFHNGGMPLFERRRGDRVEELLLAIAPKGSEGGFATKVHVSHRGVGEIRSRYWRPALRAPRSVAAGDLGELGTPPTWSIWSDHDAARATESIVHLVDQDLLPWLDAFDDPELMRLRLGEGDLRLVDASTALELVLADLGTRDARQFLRGLAGAASGSGVAPERGGFDLATDRIATIAAYFRL